MNKNYGGVIWTNHAIGRMQEREIKQSDAWVTWRNPDQSKYAKARGAWIYYKDLGKQRVQVVSKKNENGEWIILSVWSRQISGVDGEKASQNFSVINALKKLIRPYSK
jgi:hypothetical protein